MVLLDFYNEVCKYNNAFDDLIYNMDEFDDLMSGLTPLEVVGEVDTEFNIHHDFTYFNGRLYESLDESDARAHVLYHMSDHLEKLGEHNYMYEVVPEDLGCDNLEEVLEEYPYAGTMADLVSMYADNYDTLEDFLIRVRVYKCGDYYVGVELW